jgi:hypothetical protein
MDDAAELDEDGPIPDGWSHLTPEQRAELDERFAEARAAIERGDPGIPMDEVLPRRFAKAG